MKRPQKIVIEILIALAVSLVINFSHLMLIFLAQDAQPVPPSTGQHQGIPEPRDVGEVRIEGIFHLSADGHGYITYDDADSAYVSYGKVYRSSMNHGDTITATITLSNRGIGQHAIAQNIMRRNGEVVIPYASTTSPKQTSDFITQLLYYFILSLVVIMVATSHSQAGGRKKNLSRLLMAISLAVILYFFAPLISPRQRGGFIFNLLFDGRTIIDLMVTLKWSFAVIVSLLYAQIYFLISQRQNIILENERLRSESINAQYDMLMSQINPHMLFNSLNSLSMLVREHDEQRSLTYIEQLSYTFRYILQNRASTLTTLAEEMSFVEAYIYHFNIRYADKLFFDIEIDPLYNDYLIPALSLQPLLDNAVKHNTILSSRPFHVLIRVTDGTLEVSNKKYPKLEAEPSTGVGLENLSRRWQLIADAPIDIESDGDFFVVKLPLIKPREQ